MFIVLCLSHGGGLRLSWTKRRVYPSHPSPCCLRATAEDSCQAACASFSFSVHRRRPSHLVSPAARLLRCDRPSQTWQLEASFDSLYDMITYRDSLVNILLTRVAMWVWRSISRIWFGNPAVLISYCSIVRWTAVPTVDLACLNCKITK